MIAGPAPHAVLMVGPPAVGKTTLALDLAAGLLCSDPDPGRRPCRACRACRQVASGNHPDLHRLAPEGPGGQVRLGDPHHPEPGSVRHLVTELALLAVEGGARVAVVEQAHRLNEDAQNALLKTLEEPPAAVTIVLCADDEEALLPTVRSRCVRLRLGPVGARAIEALLAERGLADAPTAARLSRLAEGRPGLALAYAATADAPRRREALARRLLDLVGAARRERLVAVRELLGEAGALAASLSDAHERLSRVSGAPSAEPGVDREGGRDEPTETGPSDPAAAGADGPEAPADGGRGLATRQAPAERRRAAAALVGIWTAVARDLAIVAAGGNRGLHDPSLLEELQDLARRLPSAAPAAFLDRLVAAAGLLEGNANPELVIDVLALAWPRPDGSPAAPARPALEVAR